MRLRVLACCAALLAVAAGVRAQSPRIASDFEIAKVESQLARERDRLSIVAARLNLGDLHASRAAAQASRYQYLEAASLAAKERSAARKAGDLSRYASATAYAGLASAKLGRTAAAWDHFMEATRYAGDSSTLWNLTASGMLVAGQPGKSAAAARNALRLARSGDSLPARLDRSIYSYTLAAALAVTATADSRTEAIGLLERVIAELESPAFEPVRSRIRAAESFEVLSSTRSDVEAYLSLMQRSRMRLASLYEAEGRDAAARGQIDAALRTRRDDAIALGALSRMAEDVADRDRYFAEAFAANPFSWQLLTDYTAAVRAGSAQRPAGAGPGDLVRSVAFDLERGASAATLTVVGRLAADYPGNELVTYLRARALLATGDHAGARAAAASLRVQAMRLDLENRLSAVREIPPWLTSAQEHVIDPAESELRLIADAFAELDATDRARLDATTLESSVVFDSTETAGDTEVTVFVKGSVGELRFRFAQPTAFRGQFQPRTPLRLTYRILGAEFTGEPTLILEPLGVAP